MFWSVCACAGPGQLKAAARAGVAGGRCSGSVSPSVVVPGVGPRKPAAVRLSAAHHAATAAVLPLLLLLSLNDGLVLNCPARCAEQTTAVTAPQQCCCCCGTCCQQHGPLSCSWPAPLHSEGQWAQLCHCRRSHQESSEITNLGHLKPFSSGRII